MQKIAFSVFNLSIHVLLLHHFFLLLLLLFLLVVGWLEYDMSVLELT